MSKLPGGMLTMWGFPGRVEIQRALESRVEWASGAALANITLDIFEGKPIVRAFLVVRDQDGNDPRRLLASVKTLALIGTEKRTIVVYYDHIRLSVSIMPYR
jgi:hypothetical protein